MTVDQTLGLVWDPNLTSLDGLVTRLGSAATSGICFLALES